MIQPLSATHPVAAQPIAAHKARRAQLAERLGPGVAIIPTTGEIARNADSTYPFRFDSGFFYLTGFTEPDAVFVQVIGADRVENILFCREKDEEREIWDGYRYGPDAAREAFGFDAAYPIDELDERLPQLLGNQPAIHFALGADTRWDMRLSGWLNKVRSLVRTGVQAPSRVNELRAVLNELRLVKDEHEFAILRAAGRINAAAHQRAMRFARPGQMEYELEAEILHDYYRQGSRFPAYSSIVASGPNACVLHYGENNRRMQNGELVLIDAGCEINGYASDITRTFPVNGTFTPAQKAVYEITLAAMQAAFDAAKPGNTWNMPHDAATRVLIDGMRELKLLTGSADEILENGSYKQFYMHRTGHWMGLDVHDVGDYQVNGQWRTLAPGMVFTVEPGFYIRPAANVPKEFEHIGIRIEDDLIITADGHENLTAACPKDVAGIEALMAER
ncbi:Xaa-Pro aminopeptidase [Chitinilyticum piscinae]|uniref:Xaa-Pro aminopeptidase n=1 Tax=Chitinilyticum piscinae TaxID=2866724 RepID=A0A8J7FS54_9NEIS|nr:Xaa-Pro aminopeptidase [Chitinilyticum piscinae]MBE9611009.1 Xaa-Pro aminopeptidase [Chitinilyticum piscinae]